MRNAWITAVLLFAGLVNIGVAGDKAEAKGQTGRPDMWFYLKCKVLDRFGVATPNVPIAVVALDKQGRPEGPAFFSESRRTKVDGMARFGTAPGKAPKADKFHIVARHPSIGEIRRTVERDDLWFLTQATRTKGPLFVLRAKGGVGLDAWRKKAAKEAVELVAALAKAENADRIEALTKQIATRERTAVAPLLKVLADYDNPRRDRFVNPLCAAWRFIGPIDEKVNARARAIHDVRMSVGILRVKPRSRLRFADTVGKWPGEYSAYVVKELQWTIPRMKSRIAEFKKTGGVGEVGMLQLNLKTLQDQLAEMKKALGEIETRSARWKAKRRVDDFLWLIEHAVPEHAPKSEIKRLFGDTLHEAELLNGGVYWLYVKCDAAKGQNEALSIIFDHEGKFRGLGRKSIE